MNKKLTGLNPTQISTIEDIERYPQRVMDGRKAVALVADPAGTKVLLSGHSYKEHDTLYQIARKKQSQMWYLSYGTWCCGNSSAANRAIEDFRSKLGEFERISFAPEVKSRQGSLYGWAIEAWFGPEYPDMLSLQRLRDAGLTVCLLEKRNGLPVLAAIKPDQIQVADVMVDRGPIQTRIAYALKNPTAWKYATGSKWKGVTTYYNDDFQDFALGVFATGEPLRFLDLDGMAIERGSIAGRKMEWSAPGAGAIPARGGHTLRPYQREAVDFAIRRDGRCIFGDEMGLGKTASAIATAHALSANKVLVICPLVARSVWENEIEAWSSVNQKPVIRQVGSTAGVSEGVWDIVHYDLLVARKKPVKKKGRTTKNLSGRNSESNIARSLAAIDYDLVIVDEAHRIKNADTKRTKVVRTFCARARHVLLLTGTPLRNSGHDGFALAEALHSKALDELGPSPTSHLRQVLRQIMIRRTKAEVLPELPPKIRQRVDIPLREEAEAELSSVFRDVVSAYRAALDAGLGMFGARREALGHLERARSALAVMKLQTGLPLAMIRQVLLEDEPLVVFLAHRAAVDTLSTQLTKVGVAHGVIDGRVSHLERDREVERFKSGGIDVLVATLHTAGEALTLTRCSTVVFLEFDWVPSVLLQAEDRCHRLGQKRECVRIYHLAAKLSLSENLDTVMLNSLRKKIDLIEGFLQDGTSEALPSEKGQALKDWVLDWALRSFDRSA